MAITDELRAWAHGPDEGDDWLDRIDEFCDHIDVAHRSALEKLAAQVDETGDMREFCERLDRAATSREDVQLWGVDYVPVPVDVDGAPIHVGDVMENIFCPSVHREATGVGVECFYGWDEGNARYSQFDAVCYRHRHASTVEDVLREFALVCEDAGNAGPEVNRLAAEYAAKLRLAEEVGA